MQPNGTRPVIVSFRVEHLLGWGVTLALCLIPIGLWAQIHPLSTIQGFSAIMLAIGRVTGLVGLVMYALNLMYSTRLRFLEYFFGGLNRVYIAHHLLGGLALIMLSLHPLFLSLRYIHTSLKQAALLLLPNGLFPLNALFNTSQQYHGLVLEQWAVFFGILAFWGMVGLLLVTFFVKIPYHIWLLTHKYLGLAFLLAGLHILFITSDTSTATFMKYYILSFVLLGLIAFVYKSLLGRIFIRTYRYSVSNCANLGGDVLQIDMRPERPESQISYKAGQFVFIRFFTAQPGTIPPEWHPFTISSHPDSDKLQITVKALGDYTTALQQLTPGTIAEIEGAYGMFTNRDYKNQNQVWIAGGIGITPFLSMAQALPDSGYHVDLYYSVRTRSELIDFNKLADAHVIRHGNLKLYPYIGDEQTGHLTADFIEQTSGSLDHKDVFLCGPPPMMQSLRQQLKTKSVPGARIHTEEFGMS